MSQQALRSGLQQLRKRRVAKRKVLRRGAPLKEGDNGEGAADARACFLA